MSGVDLDQEERSDRSIAPMPRKLLGWSTGVFGSRAPYSASIAMEVSKGQGAVVHADAKHVFHQRSKG